MHNMFVKKSAEEGYVKLSNGRMMSMEDLIMDYERLLKHKNARLLQHKRIAKKLNVGKWFRIDREIINKSQEEIRRKCEEAGDEGKEYWKRFKKSNKIADENPDRYTTLIETYIFKHGWYYKSKEEMKAMCQRIGEGMCDEVICDLELQMRICNGESANVLFKKPDKLPCVRIIEFRNGCTGGFGGSRYDNCPPADLYMYYHVPTSAYYYFVPYAFRRVLS